eukprot:12423488-Karenia_brevis.AAC.1
MCVGENTTSSLVFSKSGASDTSGRAWPLGAGPSPACPADLADVENVRIGAEPSPAQDFSGVE